jgi:hypothetical protein
VRLMPSIAQLCNHVDGARVRRSITAAGRRARKPA